MVRLMLVTFAFLAWAFYEMSGGADFNPDRARLESADSDPLKPAETPRADASSDEMEVTRVSLDLTSVDDVVRGRDTSRATTRLPQQAPSTDEPRSSAGNDIQIIPSLIQNATPEGGAADLDPEDRPSETNFAVLDTGADIRVVDGSRVNVRGGPGTNYGVVDTLVRGDRVEVLEDSGTGWVRMRAADGTVIGWMADFLLTDR